MLKSRLYKNLSKKEVVNKIKKSKYIYIFTYCCECFKDKLRVSLLKLKEYGMKKGFKKRNFWISKFWNIR